MCARITMCYSRLPLPLLDLFANEDKQFTVARELAFRRTRKETQQLSPAKAQAASARRRRNVRPALEGRTCRTPSSAVNCCSVP